MQPSLIEQQMLKDQLPSIIPLPNLETVWHDYNDPDLELCIAQGPTGYPCGLTAIYVDEPNKTAMKYCELHKFHDGFKPTHILKDMDEKDTLDD